jgi:hypothetical protein
MAENVFHSPAHLLSWPVRGASYSESRERINGIDSEGAALGEFVAPILAGD